MNEIIRCRVRRFIYSWLLFFELISACHTITTTIYNDLNFHNFVAISLCFFSISKINSLLPSILLLKSTSSQHAYTQNQSPFSILAQHPIQYTCRITNQLYSNDLIPHLQFFRMFGFEESYCPSNKKMDQRVSISCPTQVKLNLTLIKFMQCFIPNYKAIPICRRILVFLVLTMQHSLPVQSLFQSSHISKYFLPLPQFTIAPYHVHQ